MNSQRVQLRGYVGPRRRMHSSRRFRSGRTPVLSDSLNNAPLTKRQRNERPPNWLLPNELQEEIEPCPEGSAEHVSHSRTAVAGARPLSPYPGSSTVLSSMTIRMRVSVEKTFGDPPGSEERQLQRHL